ncbi:zinc-binding dehydrogenase [Gulosibacter sp. ACHW.36C]|uniref:Uncharacterized protein n=1 Tax=Gulosibacter sediminis TaxID=1729695 RepID=A0ABY4MV81_9MICO|nr:zinc-binding dehydrogenase [Gulosibacter sediminis]UQN13709.1 hypothetical protein M3M28_06340 [Gulosibacter sediminis]
MVTIEVQDAPVGVVQVNGVNAAPDALDRVLELISAKPLRSPVAATYTLDQFHHAISHQRSRHVHGKIAISTPLSNAT